MGILVQGKGKVCVVFQGEMANRERKRKSEKRQHRPTWKFSTALRRSPPIPLCWATLKTLFDHTEGDDGRDPFGDETWTPLSISRREDNTVGMAARETDWAAGGL
jgi:hypothetical protein